MITLTQVCEPRDEPDGVLVLPFELRQKSRLRAHLKSGEEAALILPRGTLLRGGDFLRDEDGRVVRVVAATELVYRVQCRNPHELARCAYHLGNRHVALQIGDGWLRIGRDTVLAAMLEGLGAQVHEEEAPFEPEGGAYDVGHSHAGHSRGGDSHNHAPYHPPVIHRHEE